MILCLFVIFFLKIWVQLTYARSLHLHKYVTQYAFIYLWVYYYSAFQQ